MILNDNELRQALAVMESYKQRVEALSEQVQVLRVSLEEVTMTSNAIKQSTTDAFDSFATIQKGGDQ